MTIAVLCAAGVGSLGGGLIALHVSPESSSTQATTPSSGRAATLPKPVVISQPIAPPIAPPDPHAALLAQIQAVLGRVPDWARTHPGAPCPEVTALGIAAIDPWGHRIELTCTDQPADQILGAVSAGPDGIPGNLDDVKSWNLGPTVTQLVQGRRWGSASGAPGSPLATKPSSGKRRKDASSMNDRDALPPRNVSAKSSGRPRFEPATSISPASASNAPAPGVPMNAGDGIPTRR